MNGEHRQQTTADPRPAYDPPRALRLSSTESGAGMCEGTGSGDSEACVNSGNSATGPTGGCSGNGNGASWMCVFNGNSVI